MGSLHQCLREGRYKQFFYLIKLKANVNELDGSRLTPLITICNIGDDSKISVQVIKTLIENGAYTEVNDEEGLSPLHITCKLNKPNITKHLLQLLPDVPINSCDIFGNTPLHYACSHESTDLISMLLPLIIRYRVSIDERNKLGFTPLLIAASNGRLDVARQLHETGCVSSLIIDSLYFKSTEQWLRMYYEWPSNQNIFSQKTRVTSKDTDHIKIEKQHLMPVVTRPPVNELLDSFSRQQSAVQSSPGKARLRIPKIVITRPSTASRPRTAPQSKRSGISSTPRLPLTRSLQEISNRRLTLTRESVSNGITSGYIGRRNIPFNSSPETEYSLCDSSFIDKINFKSQGSSLASLVEMNNICSEQLSQSYRKTITPIIVPNDDHENKEGGKAAALLLGVLGKMKKSGGVDDMIPTIEEDVTTPRMSVKAKLLKHGLKKVTALSDVTAGENSSLDRKTSNDTSEVNEKELKASTMLQKALLNRRRDKQQVVDG